MRVHVPMAVYVVAFVIGHSASQAENDRDWVADIVPVSVAPESSDPPVAAFNGFQTWRASPDFGAPGSAGFGFQHFAFPMHRYSTWYRPRASTLRVCQRCEQDAFRPRGFGHLFAVPCDEFRMEYSPHALCTDKSQYGPSYIARQPDQRCNHCVHGNICGHIDHLAE